MSNDLRTAIWNVLLSHCLVEYHDWYLSQHFSLIWPDGFTLRLYMQFINAPGHLIPDSPQAMLKDLYRRYCEWAWYEVYDFAEFVLDYSENRQAVEVVNQVLERERSAYRFVGGQFVEVSGELEVQTLNEALSDSGFPSAECHLKSAAALLSDMKRPDYRNSIKESISAVESMVQEIAGDKKASFGDGLKRLEISGAGVRIAPALKQGFSALYGYSSSEDGIRHAMHDEPHLTAADARFFLVICAAFINYLKSKI